VVEELALAATAVAPGARPVCPATVIEQIDALKALAESASARARDTLAIRGELQQMPDGRYEPLAVAAWSGFQSDRRTRVGSVRVTSHPAD
jgi:hypothetical protein